MTSPNRSGRFAPSRFYFPLSRLIAFALLRANRVDEPGGRYSFTFHNEHSRVEAPAISSFLAVFTYFFWVAVFRNSDLAWGMTLLLAFVCGTLHWTVWVCGFGVVISLLRGWKGNRLVLQTSSTILCTLGMSAYMLHAGGIYFMLAAVWLLFLMLNLLAWPISRALSGAMEREEALLSK